MGQHHRGCRPDPPAAAGSGLRADLAAGHQSGRDQVRQDRSAAACGWIRAGPARTSSSSSGSGPSTPRSGPTCAASPSSTESGSRSSTRPPPAHPERRQAQRALAVEVTTMVHGADEARRAEHAAAVLFTRRDRRARSGHPGTRARRRPDDDGRRGTHRRRRCHRRRALCCSRSWPRHAARPDSCSPTGAIYINGTRVAEDRPLGAEDALHGRWIVLRQGRADPGCAGLGRLTEPGRVSSGSA